LKNTTLFLCSTTGFSLYFSFQMSKVWLMDRKSQKNTPVERGGSTLSHLDVKSYVEVQRKKMHQSQNPTQMRSVVRAARAHLTTLTARHQLREKHQVEATLLAVEAKLADVVSGVCHEAFDAMVSPYLILVQQMEEARTKKDSTTKSRPRSRGMKTLPSAQTLKHPKCFSSPAEMHVYDENSLRAELTMVLENETIPAVFVVQGDVCESCNVTMVVMATEALLKYPRCSHTRPYLQATSSRIPYGEEVEFVSFSYKRQNHFQEWLNAIQAKENTEVPVSVIDDVMEYLYHKNGIRSVAQITQTNLRYALKQMGMRKQYDHTMQIYVSITGKHPPRFSTFQEEQLRIMFEAIQGPFQKHCPPERKNFLSYSYCLYKFCELVGYDHFLQYFMLLKGVEKLRKQDIIFKKICTEMDWQFIPSYKEKEVRVGATAPPGATLEGIINNKRAADCIE